MQQLLSMILLLVLLVGGKFCGFDTNDYILVGISCIVTMTMGWFAKKQDYENKKYNTKL